VFGKLISGRKTGPSCSDGEAHTVTSAATAAAASAAAARDEPSPKLVCSLLTPCQQSFRIAFISGGKSVAGKEDPNGFLVIRGGGGAIDKAERRSCCRLRAETPEPTRCRR